jgi:hypothetical protein
MNKLYTIGYHALRGVYALLDQAVPLDATIIDIRMKPWSQRSDWTQESLLKRLVDLQFGGIKCRYTHIQELGNVNYNRPGYPIQLLHEEYGIARLEEQLKFKPAILLCQCPKLEVSPAGGSRTGYQVAGRRGRTPGRLARRLGNQGGPAASGCTNRPDQHVLR